MLQKSELIRESKRLYGEYQKACQVFDDLNMKTKKALRNMNQAWNRYHIIAKESIK